MRYLELRGNDLAEGAKVISKKRVVIDQFRASSIAGNGVIGSVRDYASLTLEILTEILLNRCSMLSHQVRALCISNHHY